ncbi:MAG: toll/interleukin-1 receptor domain-containing protein [Terriglobales bacterium]
MAYDVFISYASKDKVAADAACAVLEARNIRCWIAPRDVRPGQPYGEAIIDAIQGCRVMVLIFSSNANVSGHIPKEVERAVSHGVTIIPLRIEDVTPAKSLDYFIGSVHWLDAMTLPLESHLANLADTIDKIVPGRPAGQAAGPISGIPALHSSTSVTRKPLAPPAEKRGLPPVWIYGGAAAALAIAVLLGWLLWRGKPIEQTTVQPSPPAALATSPELSNPAPVANVPHAGPSNIPLARAKIENVRDDFNKSGMTIYINYSTLHLPPGHLQADIYFYFQDRKEGVPDLAHGGRPVMAAHNAPNQFKLNNGTVGVRDFLNSTQSTKQIFVPYSAFDLPPGMAYLKYDVQIRSNDNPSKVYDTWGARAFHVMSRGALSTGQRQGCCCTRGESFKACFQRCNAVVPNCQ